MKFFYPDFENAPQIGDLLKWKDMPMGSYGAYRTFNGHYHSPFPVVISKESWVINPDENGITYIQGITRKIDPDQFVLYLGKIEDYEKREAYLSSNKDYPMENVN